MHLELKKYASRSVGCALGPTGAHGIYNWVIVGQRLRREDRRHELPAALRVNGPPAVHDV